MTTRVGNAPRSFLSALSFLAALALAGCVAHHHHYPDEDARQTPAPTVAPPNAERAAPRGQPGRSPAEPAPAPAPRAEPPPPPVARTPPPPPPQPEPPPPPVRPAPPPPRGRLGMSLIPAKAVFLPGESIPVRVVLTNSGPGAAVVYEMRRAFMNFSLVDERGRVTVCQREDADIPRRIEAGRFLRLHPGASIDQSVHLDRFCGELSPGTFQVRLSYVLPPAFDGAAFGLFATTGSFETVTTIRVETPAPRANLALGLSRTRRTRADEPFEVTVRLQNRGPDAGLVLPPGAGPLSFDIRDSMGRQVDCSLPAVRAPRRADFVSLDRGQHLETTVDLADHCDLREGEYEIFATYELDPSFSRGLPPADVARVVHDAVVSNRLPFEREAARPRATITLEASLPVDVVAGQGAIPVMLLAVNEGPDQVVLAVPGIHLVTARIEREGGGGIGCRVPAYAQRPPQGSRLTRRVRPGAAATGQIDLRALCELDQPGRYFVTLTYTVPEDEAGIDEWTGTATAEPVLLTIERERRASPALRPAHPAPEPERSHRSDPSPGIVLTGPEEVRSGQPLEVTVELFAGREDLVIAQIAPWMISWTVQDRYGRRLPCATPAIPPRGPTRSDFVSLRGSQSVSISADLTSACGVTEPGRYFVTAQLHLPRSWDGRGHRMEAWTGTLVSSPLTVEVRDERGRGRGR